ncbi:MAG: hypothetical protein CME69_08800 [Halobacteriovorax sp.]|nr:hypothetical protein [Halobacteriovorax sp.]|tara:strand:- start:4294 stop:4836 length:543 start_codon:yes stop_codon:yes gene_type:complete
MKEKTIAKAYAKAIYELGETNNASVADDLTKLTETINVSNDLENLFFLESFTIEEKQSVLTEVLNKLGLSPITCSFLKFLLEEKRFGLLPLIFKEIIVIDDHKKGFLRGTIEGSDENLSEEYITKIQGYLKEKLGLDPKLTYVKNDKISAGVRVTVDDYQLDASLDKQLDEFKQSIINNG